MSAIASLTLSSGAAEPDAHAAEGNLPGTATAARLGRLASTPDITVLQRLWQTAKMPNQRLPFFEEVAIGHLGDLAGNVGLVATDRDGNFTIRQAGYAFEAWLDRPAQDLPLDSLPSDSRRSLGEVLHRALDTGQPAQITTHGVRGSFVGTYDLAALPLANRWGPPLLLAYAREREEKYSLVDAMFRATSEGLLAIAAVRDAEDRPYDFQIVALNEGAARLMHRPAAELRWERLSELFGRLKENGALSRLLAVLESGRSEHFELEYERNAGGTLHLGVSASPMGDLLTVILSDIGDLKTREASFRLLFDNNPVPMWVFDPETLRFLAVNEAAVEHYGYGRDAFTSMSLLDIRMPEERERVKEAVAAKTDLDGSERLWRHLRADGSKVEVISYSRAITYQGRPARLVAVIDVTEQRRAEARISHMAHHDALTALPNRVLFRQRLDEALGRVRREGETIAVLCLDLDDFKGVNDTLGHPVGDALLEVVAQRLKECVRTGDLVGRLGGDEFAILQTGLTDPEDAGELAGRLVDALSSPYEIDGHQILSGVSIGIALSPRDAETPDQLLKNADMALYRAKEDGRRTHRFFEKSMDARVRARREMELDLRLAIGSDQFELHYQPQVCLERGRVVGVEALLRWHHPERGSVPPDQFIPIAEEIGAIVPLGQWVLRQACADAASWPDDIRVAVNLSSVQFRSRDLTDMVGEALDCAGLPATRLEVEITESVLLRESRINLATLHRLRELGIRISMDDFGTGYSSLSYLRAFPFDKIKIDRSFIREIAERSDCRAIVRAVAELGASLGISTTAEGVETQEQLEHLRRAGCTEAQGFLFSRPRPAREVPALLRSIGARATAAA